MISYEGFCWDEFEKGESNFYSLEKKDGRGILFPLFSFFFPHFSPTLKREEKYLPNVVKEIFSFSRD